VGAKDVMTVIRLHSAKTEGGMAPERIDATDLP
jgi:hypothetical protein